MRGMTLTTPSIPRFCAWLVAADARLPTFCALLAIVKYGG
jgi:hypothetical protein